MQVKCEIIDAPDEPITLKQGWTISERPGIGVINPRAFLTPIQRIYIDLLKRGRHVHGCERIGNVVRVKIIYYSDLPETQLIEHVLEPKK